MAIMQQQRSLTMKKTNILKLAILFGLMASSTSFAATCPSGTPVPTLSFSPDPILVARYVSGMSPRPSAAITVSVTNPHAGVSYSFSVKTAATHAVNTTINSTTGIFDHTPDKNYTGSDSVKIQVKTTCEVDGKNLKSNITIPIVVASPTPPMAPSGTGGVASMGVDTGNIAGVGAIIIDNTPNPGTPGVMTNMQTHVGTGNNLNIINQFDFDGLQVFQRQPNNDLRDEIGVTNTSSTDYGAFGTNRQTNYFVNGEPVLDLDRLRVGANWLRDNVSPTAGHPAGTYGTITWMDFVRNVASGTQMYGIVRVLVPLRLKQAHDDHDGDGDDDHNDESVQMNALLQSVPSTTIYNFCTQSEHGGDGHHDDEGHEFIPGCGNAPVKGIEFDPGDTMNGYSITDQARIRVKGSLFLDFVNVVGDAVNPAAGTPIKPENLPFHPKDLFIETAIPFDVNPAADSDDDGIMDHIDFVDSVSKNISCTAVPCTYAYPNPQAFSYAHVTQSAKDRFRFQTGVTLDQDTYNIQNTASKYHLLMPTGYEQGWSAAMTELGVTGDQWRSLGFGVPASSTTSVPTVAEIRSSGWEDFPCYISTGGLFSMRHHVNFSGLLYIPQAIEMVTTYRAAGRQYVMGGILVRDGFYIESIHDNTADRGIVLIASDGASFSSIKVIPGSILNSNSFKSASSSVGGGAASNPATALGASSGGADTCVGCAGTSGGGAGAQQTKGNLFVIIRP